MTLYTPSSFASRDRTAALQLIADHPFATLITGVDGEESRVTHLPLLREDGALCGHMARANPHWRDFDRGRTVAVFHGPHAYVSPRWYETPAQHVPTWNYAVVHVAGTPVLLDVDDARRAVVELTARFDPDFTADMRKLETLLPAIVAFRMPVARLDAKFKMNQNRSAGDRAGVVAALAASAVAGDRAVADWMRTHD
jgi:transcriptional regulator